MGAALARALLRTIAFAVFGSSRHLVVAAETILAGWRRYLPRIDAFRFVSVPRSGAL